MGSFPEISIENIVQTRAFFNNSSTKHTAVQLISVSCPQRSPLLIHLLKNASNKNSKKIFIVKLGKSSSCMVTSLDYDFL